MAVVLDEFNFDTLLIAQDLLNAGEECSQRGLNNTAKWYSSYLQNLISPKIVILCLLDCHLLH